MIVSHRIASRKKRRTGFQFLFTFAATTAMIATGGFGLFPDNPLTQTFQQVIGESVPAAYLQPFNSYMERIAVPTIQPGKEVGSGNDSPPDPIGTIQAWFFTDTSIPFTETPLASPTFEPTQTIATSTQVTLSPTVTVFMDPFTDTPTQTSTIVPLFVLPTRTLTPKPPAATANINKTLTYFPPSWTLTSQATETPTSTSTNTPTETNTPSPTLPTPFVLYSGGMTNGNIGTRTNADSFCANALPSGYTNYHAFISYTSADSIANMPANYGISSTVQIQSASGNVIAKDWADLTDGFIQQSLASAGVVSVAWWSGAEDASGSHIDSVTADCTEWTSNMITVGGNYGDPNATDSTWITAGGTGACDQSLAILCIGY